MIIWPDPPTRGDFVFLLFLDGLKIFTTPQSVLVVVELLPIITQAWETTGNSGNGDHLAI